MNKSKQEESNITIKIEPCPVHRIQIDFYEKLSGYYLAEIVRLVVNCNNCKIEVIEGKCNDKTKRK